MLNTKKKIYIIVNPMSGKSKAEKKKLPKYAAQLIDPHLYDMHFMLTGYAGHAFEIAADAVADNAYLVVAVGGDGTVNEVARALVNTDTLLGIIPLGSGNGLARDLGIPTNLEEALKVLTEGNKIKMDYGIANDRIFFCTCGVGFDANVAYNINGHKNRGFMMYMKEMIDAFFKQKPQTYEIIYPEGQIKEEMFLVTCANAGQYGYHAYIAPHADVQDGLLDVAMLHPLKLHNIPKLGAQMFGKNLDENSKMTIIKTKELTIVREKEGPMHLDGDAYHVGKEINVKIIHQGLNVIVPINPAKLNMKDPAEMFISVVRSIVRNRSDKKKEE